MKTYKYKVIPLDAYKIIAKCPTCKTKKRFYSSGKFRVNANNKSLDAWLIYNCEKCDTTHNVRIYSGINPKQLDNTVLERFMNNDSELALFYGTSKNLFSSNNEVIGRFCTLGGHISANYIPTSRVIDSVRRPCVNLRWMLSVADRRRETQEQNLLS